MFQNMVTVPFLLVGVVLIAAGLVMLRLDRRGRTPQEPDPEPPSEPGSLFRDPQQGR
jgi:hypothetical protein